MCLIIETQKEIHIPKFVMEDMFKRNDDGFGFMYIRNGHAVGEKFHSNKLEELYDRYLELREFSPFIHLRMKTHGEINEEMSHPYYCGKGVWLMHNGVLGECQGDDKTKSDTWYFANDYLRPMFENSKDASELIRSRGFKELVTRFIGGNNRIVLADRLGTLRFNPTSWHTISNEETQCVGMRVSNTYAWELHRPKAKVTHHYGGDGTRTRTTVPTTTSPCRLPSHAGDPAGSFRDLNDRLWILNGQAGVWILASSLIGTGSEGVPQSHPTFPSNNASGSSGNIIVRENGKSNESASNDCFPHTQTLEAEFTEEADDGVPKAAEMDEAWRECYWEWLSEQWQELDYAEIYKRVKEMPDEAADFIALFFEKTLNHDVIDKV